MTEYRDFGFSRVSHLSGVYQTAEWRLSVISGRVTRAGHFPCAALDSMRYD